MQDHETITQYVNRIETNYNNIQSQIPQQLQDNNNTMQKLNDLLKIFTLLYGTTQQYKYERIKYEDKIENNQIQLNNNNTYTQLIQQLTRAETQHNLNNEHTTALISNTTQNNTKQHNKDKHQQQTQTKNTCKNCNTSHTKFKCPAYGKICEYCNKPNHIKPACYKLKRDIKQQTPHQNMLTQQQPYQNMLTQQQPYQNMLTQQVGVRNIS
eukprot:Pgem_evm1s2929